MFVELKPEGTLLMPVWAALIVLLFTVPVWQSKSIPVLEACVIALDSTVAPAT
jgi:hypothetical protein